MERVRNFLTKNKLFLFLLLLGMLLTLFTGKNGSEKPVDRMTDNERRLADTLSSMNGVGKVKVLLSGEGTRYEDYSGNTALYAERGFSVYRVGNG